MNNYDVSGILLTYSEKARKAETTEKLRNTVRELKRELILANIQVEEVQE